MEVLLIYNVAVRHKEVRGHGATFGLVSSYRNVTVFKRILKFILLVVIILSLVVVMIARHFFKK